MRNSYPSDISRAQFEEIRPILESAGKRTKPRKVDLYEVFCALRFLIKSGCQWRMLPGDYPKWSTVYVYFSIWQSKDDKGESILDSVLKKNGIESSHQR